MKISIPFLIALLIGFVILILIAVFAPSTLRDLNKAVIGIDPGFENDTVTTINAVEMYKTFYNDYKACKLSSDMNCVCELSLYQLPEGYNIQLESAKTNLKNQITTMKLVNSKGENLLEGKEGELYTIEEPDRIYYPKDETKYYYDDYYTGWNFNNLIKLENSYLLIKGSEDEYEEYTPLMAQTLTGDNFNILGLYKIDQEKTVLDYPLKDSTLSFGDRKESTDRVHKTIFRRCEQIDSNQLQESKDSLKLIKEKFDDCKNQEDCSIFETKIKKDEKIYIENNENVLLGALPNKFTSKKESYAFLLEDGTPDTNFCFKYYDGEWYSSQSFFYKPAFTSAVYTCMPSINFYYRGLSHEGNSLVKAVWESLNSHINYEDAVRDTIDLLEYQKKYKKHKYSGKILNYNGYNWMYLKDAQKNCASCPDESSSSNKPLFSSVTNIEDTLITNSKTTKKFAIQETLLDSGKVCKLLNLANVENNYITQMEDSSLILSKETDKVIAWFKAETVKKQGWVENTGNCEMFYYSYSEDELLNIKVEAAYKTL